MQQTYAQIKEQYGKGTIKSQNLEGVVFDTLYGGDRTRLLDACHDAARIRCKVVEETTGVDLSLIKQSRLDNGSLTVDGSILTGIENKIGAAMIPLGVAGPVRINGQYAKGDIYLPLATNEAALVAGVQRGVKAINLSGGIRTLVTFDGMTRAPLIEAPDIYAARKIIQDLQDPALLAQLGRAVKDPFVRLESIECHQLGTKVFLRMICKTGDAMGMNGVTKAAADITRAILALYPDFRLLTISSNLCTDKKNSHINILQGRGNPSRQRCSFPTRCLPKSSRKA